MIRYLIIFPVIILGMILGISTYLQPDDLAACKGQMSEIVPCQAVDAIVVVSGGDTNARTDAAIGLYKDGWSPKLVFSGAAEDKTGLSNAVAMQRRAVAKGVPESAIYVDEYSETTRQNAENSQTIFASRNIHEIILVTSGYHQRRASLEFDKHAPNVIVYNHPAAEDRDWSMWWWANPRGWTLATAEIFKIILFYFGMSR